MTNRNKIDSRMLREAGGAEEALLAYSTSKTFRDYFKKLLTEELNNVIITSEAEESTENVNRLYHLLGQRNALRSVIKLLEDTQ